MSNDNESAKKERMAQESKTDNENPPSESMSRGNYASVRPSQKEKSSA